MFTLSYLVTPPSEALASQVQRLAMDHLTVLSSVALAPSNRLYPLYQYGLGLEVHQYFQAMGSDGHLTVECVLALDTQEAATLLGFALLLPASGATGASTLLYLAVLPSHRRHGIGQALLAEVVARYPHTEGACAISVAGWFQAQGWHLVGALGPQVVMSTRQVRTPVQGPRLDTAPIYQTLEVQQIHTYLLNQHGRKAMVDAEKQRDYRLDQLERQAQRLLASRPD